MAETGENLKALHCPTCGLPDPVMVGGDGMGGFVLACIDPWHKTSAFPGSQPMAIRRGPAPEVNTTAEEGE